MKTARLELRRLAREDLDALAVHFNRPRVRRYLWDDAAVSLDSARRVFERSEGDFARNGYGICVVRHHGAPRLLGVCGLREVPGNRLPEIIYSLEPDCWGQGLATEAAGATLEFAFGELGCECVVGGYDANNRASGRVLERLGMSYVRHLDLPPGPTPYLLVTRERFAQLSRGVPRFFPADTERLAFRELGPADADDLLQILGDPLAMKHYPKVYNREDTLGWIERQRDRYDQLGHGLWAVCDRDSGALLGQCGLIGQWLRGFFEPEIGYLFKPRHWGQGYATEAAVAVREHAFRDRHFTKVVSYISEGNGASVAVARRAGMKHEAVVEPEHNQWNLRMHIYGRHR